MTKAEYVLQLKGMLKTLRDLAEDEPYYLFAEDPIAFMQLMFELTRELYQVTNDL